MPSGLSINSPVIPARESGYVFTADLRGPPQPAGFNVDSFFDEDGAPHSLADFMAGGPKSVLFVVAGGNAPGQNAFLKPLMTNLLALGVKVLVAWQGIQTLAEDHPDIREMKPGDFETLPLLSGSVFIGTSRMPRTKKDPALVDKMAAAIKSTQAEAVVIIGGDGTLSLAKEFVKRGVSLIGVPKTMDGNLAIRTHEGLERVYSLGFLSSVEKAAEYARLLNDWGRQNGKVVIFEINGRNTGWITFETARKTGFDYLVNEAHPRFGDFLHKAYGIYDQGGGVLLVAESVEFLASDGLRNASYASIMPQKKSPSVLIQEALSAIWPNTRSIDLGVLLAASRSEGVYDYLSELLLSAINQDRINVVSLPTAAFKKMQESFLEDGVYYVTSEETLASLKDKLVGLRKTDLILVSDDHVFSDADPTSKEKFDEAGRILLSSRQVGASLSGYLNQVSVAAAHFVGTHLLMAADTHNSEARQAEVMAKAVLYAFGIGAYGSIVTFVEGLPNAQLLDLQALEDYEIPPAVLKADQNDYLQKIEVLLNYFANPYATVIGLQMAESEERKIVLKDYLRQIHSLPRRGDFISYVEGLIRLKVSDLIPSLLQVVEDEYYSKISNLKLKIREDVTDLQQAFLETLQNIDSVLERVRLVIASLMDFVSAENRTYLRSMIHAFNGKMTPIHGYYALMESGRMTDIAAILEGGFLDKPGTLMQGLEGQVHAFLKAYPESRIILSVPSVGGKLLNFSQDRLQTILDISRELISNGLYYAKERGRGHVDVIVDVDKDHFNLTVRDEGVGMSEAFISQKFGMAGQREKRAVDVASERENSGMGVWGIKSEVKKLNGTFEVASKVDEGTQIKIALPLTELASSGPVIEGVALNPLEACVPGMANLLNQQASLLAQVPTLPSPNLGMLR